MKTKGSIYAGGENLLKFSKWIKADSGRENAMATFCFYIKKL
jgi:hypothetical protein